MSLVQRQCKCKLLYFVNSLSTATSDAPAVAKPELMTNVAGITSYYQKPSSVQVRLIISFYLYACQVAPINSAEHGRRNCGKLVYDGAYAAVGLREYKEKRVVAQNNVMVGPS